MGRVKYEKVLVITPTNRGTSALRDIVNTYLEGIPHIKYMHDHLILADSKYISPIILRIWFSLARHQMHTYIAEEYSHYMSDNAYCYFCQPIDNITIVLRRKDLKVLWD